MSDPMTAYAALRERCPVHLVDDFSPPHYVVSRHDDVDAILRSPDRWSSRLGHGPGISTGALTLAYCDDPAHGEQRRLVNRAFTPRSVAQMQDRVHEIAHELIDGFVDAGSADLHDVFATPLPIIVIAEMLGVPSDRMADFKRWSDDSVLRLASGDPSSYAESAREFREFFAEAIAWRRTSLEAGETVPDDLVSRLVQAEERGTRLDDSQALGMIGQLLTAGNETTTSLLQNMVLRLCERPHLLDQLRADPSLYEVAVEESLRFDSPVLGLWRTPNADEIVGDVAIPADHKTQVLYASANRDPDVWDDPDEFRLDRPLDQLRRHLAFGVGPHYCLGASLARMEARIGLQALVERLPGLRLAGEPERIPAFFLWGVKSLPIAWD
jgi:cytochrome P450